MDPFILYHIYGLNYHRLNHHVTSEGSHFYLLQKFIILSYYATNGLSISLPVRARAFIASELFVAQWKRAKILVSRVWSNKNQSSFLVHQMSYYTITFSFNILINHMKHYYHNSSILKLLYT